MIGSPNNHYRKTVGVALALLITVVSFVVLRQKPLSLPDSKSSSASNSQGSTDRSAAGTPLELSSECKVSLKELTARLPLAFEVNKGQADARVKFFSRQNGSELFLTSNEAVLRLRDSQYPFKLQLQGANLNANVRGLDQLPGYQNYLRGNDPHKWQINVPTFRKVVYEEIYPGINLTYYGNRRDLEYDFELAPGADPHVIRLAFDSHVRPHISANGDLVLQSGDTELVERKPVVYQHVDGERRLIQGRYVTFGNRDAGFEVGEYDRTKPLVIDPTLVYSTYLGGSGDDLGSSIAVDGSNNVYIAGTTSSLNFPTHGPAFPNTAGLSDIFVTKIDSTGGNIVYSTYIGGAGLDRADGLAIDGSGNAYVVGRVGDASIDFPTTAGSLATTYRGGDFDGVVFKLNAQGTALVLLDLHRRRGQ